MTTFITRYETSGPGVRLAVKDLIDMAGEPTTAGCRAVADRAVPAARDAACLTGARDGGGPDRRPHESARAGPRRDRREPVVRDAGEPARPHPRPRGLVERSAVAVATDEADVAYGSDTGGSIRIPAACCGIAGLKTTWGRIPLDGVWPLAPSFDTIGPMARTVGGLVTGMQLLEPGFTVADLAGADLAVGRLPIDADPAITAALDSALDLVGWDCRDLALPGWDDATLQAGLLLVVEAWHSDAVLVAEDPEGISDGVRGRLELGGSFDEDTIAHGLACPAWVEGDARARLRRGRPSGDPDIEHLPAASRRRGRSPRLALHPSGEPGGGAGSLAPGALRRPVARQPAADRAGAQRGAAVGRRAALLEAAVASG